MLDLAGADTERQGTEGTVGRGVGVSANDRHSGLRVSEFWTDDVNDSLADIVQVVELNPELLAIVSKRIDLLPGNRVGDGERSIGGGNVVVRSCDRAFGPSDLPARETKPFEGLGAGDFVHEVQVDVENRLFSGLMMNDMMVPDLLEHVSG